MSPLRDTDLNKSPALSEHSILNAIQREAGHFFLDVHR